MTLVLNRARVRRLEGRLRARAWGLLYRGVEVGARVSVGRGCRLILGTGARLALSEGCEIDDRTTLAVYDHGRLVVGKGCFVGHHATLAARKSIELGTGAFLAELVSVRDHDHAVGVPPSSGKVDVASVDIGAHAWLGAKVTVLRGAQVGARTVVGANAVVRGHLPDDTLAVGIPARVVRTNDPTTGVASGNSDHPGSGSTRRP